MREQMRQAALANVAQELELAQRGFMRVLRLASASRVFRFIRSTHGAREYINRGMRDLGGELEAVAGQIKDALTRLDQNGEEPSALLQNDFVPVSISKESRKVLNAVTSDIGVLLPPVTEDVSDPLPRHRRATRDHVCCIVTGFSG
jgi:hypothetical protein